MPPQFKRFIKSNPSWWGAPLRSMLIVAHEDFPTESAHVVAALFLTPLEPLVG
jgi:hypothetical protein